MPITRLTAIALTIAIVGFGQAGSLSAEAPNAAELFPASTQGFIRVTRLPKLLERWEETQFAELSKVPGMSEFWDEQRQEIQSRLAEAGWQLNMQPTDFSEVSSGQVAFGWIDRSSNARKPYSIAAVIDTKGNEAVVVKLLERIEKELRGKQGAVEKLTHAGMNITKFTLAKKAGDLMIHESFYVQTAEQLLAADDLDTIKALIDGVNKPSADRLSANDLYINAVQHLKSRKSDDFDAEYFVKPIGLAKVMRSISKKAPARQTDMLKVLESQGFGSFSAVCGCLRIATDEYDLYHEGFVISKKPLSTSAQILDFPNQASFQIPGWASKNMSGMTSLAWNVKEAFWKFEGLVDEVAGSKNTFKYVIEGMQDDPLGPQINIRNDVMPFLTNEFYSASDCVEPITPDSKRSLIAIRVTDAAKLSKVLDRAMKNEPDASSYDFEGQRIWKVSRQDDPSLSLDDDGFNDFNKKKKKEKEKAKEVEKEEDPWLSNWAITVHKDFLMFSSHAEMIQQAIKNQANPSEAGMLAKEEDFGRAMAAIQKLADGNPNCIWQVDRADHSFEMQYELFRQDKLPQSRSMVASLLDRLLHPKTEVRDQVQKVKGDRLPTFERIKEHLMPTGTVVRTENDGWLIQSFVLKSEGPSASKTANNSARTAERKEGTASSK